MIYGILTGARGGVIEKESISASINLNNTYYDKDKIFVGENGDISIKKDGKWVFEGSFKALCEKLK